jgi:hypothetical protein
MEGLARLRARIEAAPPSAGGFSAGLGDHFRLNATRESASTHGRRTIVLRFWGKHFRGEYNLARSYLINSILIGGSLAFLVALIASIEFNDLKQAGWLPPKVIRWDLCLITPLPISYWAMVGAVRAAAKQWDAWGISAVVLMSLGCAYGVGVGLLAGWTLGIVVNAAFAAVILAYLIPARVAARRAVSP